MSDQITIPVGSLKSGFNYRRKFDPVAMQELVDDIKRQNIIQPITVRPFEGGYQVIAGNRRVAAFAIAFGENEPIPALVRIMTDAEATAAMVAENKVRQDTTAIEDAEAATRMLGLVNGDKDEVCRRLGWKPQLLERRLAIMNATASVRDAFIDDKINLGHVEVLAVLRKEVQERLITKLLSLETKVTVEQLKDMTEQALLNLNAAIFDKAACTACQFNTSNQQALFETSFDGVRCTNNACYTSKTDAELEVRKQALTETYQVVRILKPGDNFSVRKLRADGPKGVGEDQAKACRACGDFGACVSAVPDQLGSTFKDVCFNGECNSKMVQARADAEKAQEAAQAGLDNSAPADNGGATSTPGKPKGTPTAAQKPTVATIRNSVREYREDVWRKILSAAVAKLPVEKSRAFLLTMCLYRPTDIDAHAGKKALAKALAKPEFSASSAAETAKSVLAMSREELATGLNVVPAHLTNTMSITCVTQLLTAFEIDIAKFWRVNEKLFDVLTKSELEVVCEEIGIVKAMGQKEFDKAKVGKKDELVKLILNVNDFDYIGKIPTLMRW